VLNDNGPFDEPTLIYQDALLFEEGKFYRQAADEFARVKTLVPDKLEARLWLAKMDLILEAPDEAIKVLDEIQAQPEVVSLNQTNLPDMLQLEMTAHLAKGDVPGADANVQAALARFPGDTRLLLTAARAYLNYGIFSNAVTEVRAALARQPQDDRVLATAARAFNGAGLHSNAVASIRALLAKHPGDTNLLPIATQVFIGAKYYSNALETIEQQLAVDPNNPQVLVNKGYTCLQTGDYAHAIPSLTRAIEMATNSILALRLSAQLNRAIAYLRCEKLDEAQHDYEALAKAYPSAYQAYFGLLEIATRRKDAPAAIHYCQLYLTNAPPNTEEAGQVAARLKELQPAPQ
jgi:predicted Zn-dependent protease